MLKCYKHKQNKLESITSNKSLNVKNILLSNIQNKKNNGEWTNKTLNKTHLEATHLQDLFLQKIR